ncbi:hypothetical protein GJV06_15825 [Enterobacteriaceae bacterium RIT691]|nr:hypothetical protein [Enterobacteriaceae bacterium RIT691]
MPGNKEPQTVIGQLIWVTEINDIWLEIPRYENIMWGIGWLGIISMFISFLLGAGFSFIPGFFYKMILSDFMFFISYFLSLFVIFSLFLLQFRMVFLVPRDQPIRFNRKRQKVYVFDYHRNHWNPWGKWPATVKVFDWADIHGEIGHEADRYDQGFRLYCAVCKPGTREVSERFILNQAMSHPEPQRRLWSHLCQYMQHKPVVMDPVYPGRPDNWKPRKNVGWPEDLERESITAP